MSHKVLIVYSGKLGVGGANVFLKDLLKHLLKITEIQFYTLNLRMKRSLLYMSLGMVRESHDGLREYVLRSYCMPFVWDFDTGLNMVKKCISVFAKTIKPHVMFVNSVDPIVLSIVNELLDIIPVCYLVVHDGGFFCPLKHMWDPLKGRPCHMSCLELGGIPEYCIAVTTSLGIGYMQPLFNPLKMQYLKLTRYFTRYRYPRKFQELWKISRKVMSRAMIIAPSLFMADLVKKFAGVNAIVIRHGAPEELFCLAKERREAGSIRIGFVGDISLHKGIHILFQSIGIVLKKCLDAIDKVVFYVIGSFHPFSSTSMGIIRHYIKSLSDRVKLVGPTRSRTKIYSLLNVVILPSVCHENAPLTVIEGIASGKYVIASHVGGVPEYLKDYPRGILVEPGNAYELANAITYIVEMISSGDSVEIPIDTRKYVSDFRNVALKYAHLLLRNY